MSLLLDLLPTELLLRVATLSRGRDVQALACTCKTFRDICAGECIFEASFASYMPDPVMGSSRAALLEAIKGQVARLDPLLRLAVWKKLAVAAGMWDELPAHIARLVEPHSAALSDGSARWPPDPKTDLAVSNLCGAITTFTIFGCPVEQTSTLRHLQCLATAAGFLGPWGAEPWFLLDSFQWSFALAAGLLRAGQSAAAADVSPLARRLCRDSLPLTRYALIGVWASRYGTWAFAMACLAVVAARPWPSSRNIPRPVLRRMPLAAPRGAAMPPRQHEVGASTAYNADRTQPQASENPAVALPLPFVTYDDATIRAVRERAMMPDGPALPTRFELASLSLQAKQPHVDAASDRLIGFGLKYGGPRAGASWDGWLQGRICSLVNSIPKCNLGEWHGYYTDPVSRDEQARDLADVAAAAPGPPSASQVLRPFRILKRAPPSPDDAPALIEHRAGVDYTVAQVEDGDRVLDFSVVLYRDRGIIRLVPVSGPQPELDDSDACFCMQGGATPFGFAGCWSRPPLPDGAEDNRFFWMWKAKWMDATP